MPKKRPLSSLLTGLALLLTAFDASAIGWLRAQQTAVLGQPLEFAAALRLDPGDTIAPECVSAEVMVGDQRVPPSSVRVAVDNSNPEALALRVLSSGSVDEPVVVVTVSIGCPARMSRRFTLLADPPSMAPPMVALAAAPAEAAAPPPRAAAATVNPDAVQARPARAASRSESRPSAPTRNASAKKARKPVPAAPATATAAATTAPPMARLKLDPAEPPPQPAAATRAVDEAIEAVALAASATRAAAAAASNAEARIATLERTVNQMRSEANANRDLVSLLRARVAEGDGASRWMWPLLLALLLLAALTIWLAWRLRQVQLAQQASWRRAAAAEAAPRPATPTSQLPMVTSEIHLPSSPPPPPRVVMPMPAPPTRPPVPPLPTPAPRRTMPLPPMTERTEVLPPQARPDEGSPRDVSIEELLDLEQQAEFFIVLGQEEAAVDLLVDHLRNTGGGSPLPYLKLLEIYRRRNQRDPYERTRARFNHRFNAYAPDWDSDLQHGRSLEDYPGVLPRLQQVWPRPLDSMAELEALLFRKSRGELFELPAYREVLFLYSLARDLLDREAADTGNVDLLLPLSDGGEFSATSPHPYFGLERDSVFDSVAEERPTAPVDLDLTQPDTQPMIVDPQAPTRR